MEAFVFVLSAGGEGVCIARLGPKDRGMHGGPKSLYTSGFSARELAFLAPVNVYSFPVPGQAPMLYRNIILSSHSNVFC